MRRHRLAKPRVLLGGQPVEHRQPHRAFGIFSIGVGLVIITGGIDLSVGSMIALNGMLLVHGADGMALAVAAGRAVRAGACRCCSACARRAHHAVQNAAVHRDAVRTAAVSRHRALHRERHNQGFWRRGGFQNAAKPGQREIPRPADAVRFSHRDCGHHVGRAAPLGLWPLSFRGRPQRGGHALFRHQHALGHRRQLMSWPVC